MDIKYEAHPLKSRLSENYNQAIDCIFDQAVQSSNELKDFLSTPEKNKRRLAKSKDVLEKAGIGALGNTIVGSGVATWLSYTGTAEEIQHIGKGMMIAEGGSVDWKFVGYSTLAFATVGAIGFGRHAYKKNFKSDKTHTQDKVDEFRRTMQDEIGTNSKEKTSDYDVETARERYVNGLKRKFPEMTEKEEATASANFDYLQNAVDMASDMITNNDIDNEVIKDIKKQLKEAPLMDTSPKIAAKQAL